MAGRYDPYDFNANAPILPPTPPAAQMTALQPSQQLAQNPQLSATPLGAYTDSQYEAAVAQLRAQIQRQYADVLQQIGYKNDAGQFIPGTVEADAQKQNAELQRSMGLAGEEVTQQHQREGTLFSGVRGVNQGRAEHPFVSAMADLATSTPLTLAKLYDQGSGLMDDYSRQNNLLLADAAARAAAGFGTQPGQVVSPPGGPAVGTDPAIAAAMDPSTPLGPTPIAQAPGADTAAPIGGLEQKSVVRRANSLTTTAPAPAPKKAAPKKSPYFYGGGTAQF